MSILDEVCAEVASDASYGWYVQKKFAALADPEHGRRYRTRLHYELQLARATPAGAIIVDAGCGAGIYAMLMVAEGAKRVVAIDFFEHNIEALNRLTAKFNLPITPVLGDVARTSCDDASVDLVYCVEAVSHFHDTTAFLQECRRIVHEGGHVIIADGNNGANPLVRREVHNFWMASETGPFAPAHFKREDNLPFVFRRWMLIRQMFPDLRVEDVFQLGMRTTGQGGEELLGTCRRFEESGQLPEREYRRGMSQRRPEDGQRNEEPIDPLALTHDLRRLGFRAKARPHFGVSRGGMTRVLNDVGALVPGMSLRFAPVYIVHAERV